MFAGDEGRGAASSDMSEVSISSPTLEERPELRDERPGLDMLLLLVCKKSCVQVKLGSDRRNKSKIAHFPCFPPPETESY